MPEELDNRLNAYLIRIIQRNGRPHRDLRGDVIRKAVEEYLDNHENEDPPTFEVVD